MKDKPKRIDDKKPAKSNNQERKTMRPSLQIRRNKIKYKRMQ
jgi:hypothetical protein